MKFALLNDKQRIEATKGAIGICPSCGSELIASGWIESEVNDWLEKKIVARDKGVANV